MSDGAFRLFFAVRGKKPRHNPLIEGAGQFSPMEYAPAVSPGLPRRKPTKRTQMRYKLAKTACARLKVPRMKGQRLLYIVAGQGKSRFILRRNSFHGKRAGLNQPLEQEFASPYDHDLIFLSFSM